LNYIKKKNTSRLLNGAVFCFSHKVIKQNRRVNNNVLDKTLVPWYNCASVLKKEPEVVMAKKTKINVSKDEVLKSFKKNGGRRLDFLDVLEDLGLENSGENIKWVLEILDELVKNNTLRPVEDSKKVQRHCRNCLKLQEKKSCPIDKAVSQLNKDMLRSTMFDISTGDKHQQWSHVMMMVMETIGEHCLGFVPGEKWI